MEEPLLPSKILLARARNTSHPITQAAFVVAKNSHRLFFLSQNHGGRSSTSTRLGGAQEGEEGGPCPGSYHVHAQEGAPEAKGARGQGPRVSVDSTTLMNAY
jgi:hypothetical protein